MRIIRCWGIKSEQPAQLVEKTSMPAVLMLKDFYTSGRGEKDVHWKEFTLAIDKVGRIR